MTLQASRLADTVNEMLLEAGLEQDTGLRAALLSLGTLASQPAPPPDARLAALLGLRQDSLSWRRRLRRHRPGMVGLAVVAGMGLGVTGVAASASRPAEPASASIQQLLDDWAPSWNVSGLSAATPAVGLLPQPAPGEPQAAAESGTADGGQQGSLARDTPRQPARGPGPSPTGPAKTGSHGPAAGDEASSDGGAKGQADRTPAAGDSANSESKAPAGPATGPDSGQEAARQALEKSAELLSGVLPSHTVPGHAPPPESGHGSAGKRGLATKDAIKKADPGTTWLKKFSH
jgi:hypothetical protein